MSVLLGVLGALLVVLIVWVVTWPRIIREDEYAVVVTLGNPTRVIGSGLNFVIWPFQYVRRFTTNLIELNFRSATIITKAGEVDGKKYGAANIAVETSMYFHWPENEQLIQALRVVGNPQDKEGLKNLFEETVLDSFRSVGGGRVWRDIVQNRKDFAADVFHTLSDEAVDPVRQAGLRDVRLVINHLALPKELEGAITKPEIARLEAEKTEIEAGATKAKTILEGEGNKEKIRLEGEGSKEKIMREGEGYADARTRLFAAIGNSSESLQKETLHTLREMAKGTSNTIFIPTEVADALKGIGNTAKKGDLQSILTGLGLDKAKIDQVIKVIGGDTK